MMHPQTPKKIQKWSATLLACAMTLNVAYAQADASDSGDDVDRLIRDAERAQRELVQQAENDVTAALTLARNGDFLAARSLLDNMERRLTPGPLTDGVIRRVGEAKISVSILRIEAAVNSDNFEEAENLIAQHRSQFGDSERITSLENRLAARARNPKTVPIGTVSPNFVQDQRVIEDLMLTARVQFINGDLPGAQRTLQDVEILDPRNPAAKRFQEIIAIRMREQIEISRYRTRAEMINEVSESWNRPRVSTDRLQDTRDGVVVNQEILEKLSNTRIPRVAFNDQPLSRVIQTLSELSIEYSPVGTDGTPLFSRPGVNIIPGYQVTNESDPRVNLTIFGLTLDRLLNLISQQVNYEYIVQEDVVLLRPSSSSGGQSSLMTEFFPITRATVLRLTGGGRTQGQAAAAPAFVDPFAAPVAAPSGGGGSGSNEEEQLKGFFERAGVPFTSVQGASLAFDQTQLIVTQTVSNIQKLRNILRRYDLTKQVEIEAKFLEVQQGALEELGFEWNVGAFGRPTFDQSGNVIVGADGTPVLNYQRQFTSNPQSLNNAFNVNLDSTSTTISTTPGGTQSFSNLPPTFPNSLDFGSGASHRGFVSTALGAADVSVLINALERTTGSDLMSAPRLTVLSGKTAQITIAQELIYPESYGDISATASGGGGGGTTGGGSATSIAITAGTPQDFTVRNVGVEMEVTPTVEDNDNISLLLEPRVTEFEGFVEYGGPSVAVTSTAGRSSTVTVPPGFYQPIFSTREVRTEVTIYDGATVVIGGLVREEVKFIEDKVPFLGDLPLVGRLFKNKGQTTQKRNLMIFVTANLVSPGGSPSRQSTRGVEANSLFQNPVILTPGGNQERNR